MSKEKISKTQAVTQKKNDDWNDVHAQLQHVQKKSMNISSPEDESEKEADTIARQVASADAEMSVHSESGEMIHRAAEMAPGRLFYEIFFEAGRTDIGGVKNKEKLDSIDPGTVVSMKGGSSLYGESVRQQIRNQYGDGNPAGIAANNSAGSSACAEARARMLAVYNYLLSAVAPDSEGFKPTGADLSQAEYGPGSGLVTPFVEGRNIVEITGFR